MEKTAPTDIRHDVATLAPVVVALPNRLLAHSVAAALVLHGAPSASVIDHEDELVAASGAAGRGCVVLLDLSLGLEAAAVPTISELRALGARVVLVADGAASPTVVDAALSGAEGTFSMSQPLTDLVDLLAGRPANWLVHA